MFWFSRSDKRYIDEAMVSINQMIYWMLQNEETKQVTWNNYTIFGHESKPYKPNQWLT